MNTLPLQPAAGTGRFRNFDGLTRWWQAARGAAGRRAADTKPTPREVIAAAGQVRELALAYRHVNPRFADDLYAAADRHERLYLG